MHYHRFPHEHRERFFAALCATVRHFFPTRHAKAQGSTLPAGCFGRLNLVATALAPRGPLSNAAPQTGPPLCSTCGRTPPVHAGHRPAAGTTQNQAHARWALWASVGPATPRAHGGARAVRGRGVGTRGRGARACLDGRAPRLPCRRTPPCSRRNGGGGPREGLGGAWAARARAAARATHARASSLRMRRGRGIGRGPPPACRAWRASGIPRGPARCVCAPAGAVRAACRSCGGSARTRTNGWDGCNPCAGTGAGGWRQASLLPLILADLHAGAAVLRCRRHWRDEARATHWRVGSS